MLLAFSPGFALHSLPPACAGRRPASLAASRHAYESLESPPLRLTGIDSIALSSVELSLRARQQLLDRLLSAPLVEPLGDVPHVLRRLGGLLVHTAGVLEAAPSRDAAAVLVNLASLLERFAVRHMEPKELLALLSWLAWAKAGLETRPRGAVSRPLRPSSPFKPL